jgi:hypothetical protein
MHDAQLPHGFLNKFQAIKVNGPGPVKVAVQILDTLVANERTQTILAPHLVAKFERVQGSERGRSFLKRIAKIRRLPTDLLERLDKAPSTNIHLAPASVRSDIDAILQSHGYKRAVVTGGDFDEEPF